MIFPLMPLYLWDIDDFPMPLYLWDMDDFPINASIFMGYR